MKVNSSILSVKEQDKSNVKWDTSKRAKIKQILIIDDEVRFRILYKNIFNAMGYKVFTAACSTEACILLVDEEIDMVILDINIAQEDGAVLFRVMKAYRTEIKVIVSSVYSTQEQQEKIQDANGYYDKSDGKEVLAMMVCAFLDDA